MNRVWTIGYEKTRQDDLMATLAAAGIEIVVDVRERPQSRRPGFSRRSLEAALVEAGIGYRSVRALGTPRSGRDAARRGDLETLWAVFGAHLADPSAQAALAEVIDTARDRRVCLLCYEKDPRRCHRAMVVDAMAANGAFEAIHLDVGEQVLSNP
ncbi:MAG: DUF488 domain-containing protein [Azospirillaceae bacterium]